jgi:NAD(P)-dependent dehydrogenase (short-subunit alcohol dehydrogenase family)
MKTGGSVALVTGASRGLGRVHARELASRGAAQVCGAARDRAAVTGPGVTPVAIGITGPERAARVAARCTDVSLLVNNAGALTDGTFTGAPNLDAARMEMEASYFGTLSMCRAFAPVLAGNGGGAIVTMLSVTGFCASPSGACHGASKAAAWSLASGVRLELPRQGTLAVAEHASFTGTDMAPLASAAKDKPGSVARQVFGAAEAGQTEVLADERTRTVKARSRADLPAGPAVLGRRGEGHPKSAGRVRIGCALVPGQPRPGSARRAGRVARHLSKGDSP